MSSSIFGHLYTFYLAGCICILQLPVLCTGHIACPLQCLLANKAHWSAVWRYFFLGGSKYKQNFVKSAKFSFKKEKLKTIFF